MEFSTDFLQAPLFIVYVVLGLYCLAAALYLLGAQGKHLMSVLIAFVFIWFGMYLIGGGVGFLPMSYDQYVLQHRINWIPGFVGVPTIFYLSILFREKVTGKLSLQRKLFKFVGIPLVLFEAFLLYFTDLFFDTSKNIPGEIKVWAPPLNAYMFPVIIMQGVWGLLAAYNAFRAYEESKKKNYYISRFLMVFVSSAIFAFCASILLVLSYLTDLGVISSNYGLPIVLTLFMVPAQFSAILAIAEYNAFVEEGRKITRDLVATLLSLGFWMLLYLGVFSLIVLLPGGKIEMGLFLAIFGVLGIFTHHYHESVKQMIFESLQRGKLTMPTISERDINYALKNCCSLKKLSNSKLLKLQTVQLRRKKHDISAQDSLQQIMHEILDSFKPQNNVGERTRVRLKYEILRMIIEEQAVESQILWELGFNSGSLISSDKKPDLPVVKNSEYKATSIRSYRRLRKEVINELSWKLEQREKKALRLK